MAMNIGISQTGGWNIGISQTDPAWVKRIIPMFRPSIFAASIIIGMLIIV